MKFVILFLLILTAFSRLPEVKEVGTDFTVLVQAQTPTLPTFYKYKHNYSSQLHFDDDILLFGCDIITSPNEFATDRGEFHIYLNLVRYLFSSRGPPLSIV